MNDSGLNIFWKQNNHARRPVDVHQNNRGLPALYKLYKQYNPDASCITFAGSEKLNHSITLRDSMIGDQGIITLLNTQLTNELTAINQYFLHARMYRHWGYEKIAEKEYEESIDEMKHADHLINRILVLEGLPNLQALNKLMIGETPEEMLQSDLTLELASQKTVKDGIAACEAVRDYVSREVFQNILDDTEDHIDWLQTQLELIKKIGLQNYLQSQL